MNKESIKTVARKLPLALTVILLIFFILLSGVSYFFTTDSLAKQSTRRFETRTDEITSEISKRMEIYITALYGVQGLYAASDNVNRKDFANYVNTIKIVERLPGVSSLTYAPRVLDKDVSTFINSTKNDKSVLASGYPDFKVYSATNKNWPEFKKEEYFPIVYVEPIAGREKSLGFDISSESTRLATLEKARDTGMPTATPRILSVTNVLSFSIYLPIYRNNSNITNVEDRRKELQGYITAGFRINDLFNEVFKENKVENDITLSIFENNMQSEENILYKVNSEKNNLPQSKLIQRTTNINIANKNWSINFKAPNNYSMGSNAQIFASVVAGVFLLFGILLFFTLLSLLNSNRRSLKMAEKMTKNFKLNENKLQSTTTKLSSLIENLPAGILATDENGKVTNINKAFYTIFNLQISPISIIDNTWSWIKSEESKNIQELLTDHESFMKRVGEISHDIKAVFSEKIFLKDGRIFELDFIPIFVNKEFKGNLWIFRNETVRLAAAIDLKQQKDDLEVMNKIMIDRELKMIDLKEELNKLKKSG